MKSTDEDATRILKIELERTECVHIGQYVLGPAGVCAGGCILCLCRVSLVTGVDMQHEGRHGSGTSQSVAR